LFLQNDIKYLAFFNKAVNTYNN